MSKYLFAMFAVCLLAMPAEACGKRFVSRSVVVESNVAVVRTDAFFSPVLATFFAPVNTFVQAPALFSASYCPSCHTEPPLRRSEAPKEDSLKAILDELKALRADVDALKAK